MMLTDSIPGAREDGIALELSDGIALQLSDGIAFHLSVRYSRTWSRHSVY